MSYIATEFSSIKDKQKFEDQFKKFVLSNFSRNQFPRWFYVRLSNCFGHIAHYDSDGFYEEFFSSTQHKIWFLQKTIHYPCFGDPKFTYSDVEYSLKEWVIQTKIIEEYEILQQEEIEMHEKKELERLKAKYE